MNVICPPDCMERHLSNARWIKSAIQLVVAGFVAIGGLYLYCDNAYAKAKEVEEVKNIAKDQRAEIREELRLINEKLDSLADRTRK